MSYDPQDHIGYPAHYDGPEPNPVSTFTHEGTEYEVEATSIDEVPNGDGGLGYYARSWTDNVVKDFEIRYAETSETVEDPDFDLRSAAEEALINDPDYALTF